MQTLTEATIKLAKYRGRKFKAQVRRDPLHREIREVNTQVAVGLIKSHIRARATTSPRNWPAGIEGLAR